jgi:ApaG protein
VSVSEAVTRGIRVHVRAEPSLGRTDPTKRRWFYLYTITISNEGGETVKLENRHWIITDASGNVDEVRGPGVVGEQPVLEPGQRFEYTSGCPLPTPFGSMRGSYDMVVLGTGERLQVEIAPFILREHGTAQ